MNNQADVSAGASVTGAYHSLVHQDGVCTAGNDLADRLAHILQALNRADRYAVVHGNNDRLAGIAVDYSFESYLFAYHV
jgi:hypothetical protein